MIKRCSECNRRLWPLLVERIEYKGAVMCRECLRDRRFEEIDDMLTSLIESLND